jgi:hypothetical protein
MIYFIVYMNIYVKQWNITFIIYIKINMYNNDEFHLSLF